MSKVSNIIKSWKFRRLHTGLRQTDFAKKLGVSDQYIGRLFHGKTTPSLATIDKIESIFSQEGVPFKMKDFEDD